MRTFQLTIATCGRWTVAKPVGELDMASAPKLAEVGDCQRLAVDLHDVVFMDSSGMSALLALSNTHPELLLIDPSGPVLRTLELTKAISRFRIRERLESDARK